MSVNYELTCSTACWCYTKTINHIVKTCFEKLQKNFTSYAFLTDSSVECVRKLTFQNAIDVLSFLFFSQLNSIFRLLAFLGFTVLTGRIVFLLKSFALT